MGLDKPKLRLLCCIIPLVACAIAVRQVYLKYHHHLSTWKGGGMGMFAAADGTVSRYTRIFVELPDGKRQPIVGLLPHQIRMREKALWYPTEGNFSELARSLRRTAFVAANQPSPAYSFEQSGRRGDATGQSYYLLRAKGARSGGDDANWILAIEYWEIAYDVAGRLATGKLVETYRYARVNAS